MTYKPSSCKPFKPRTFPGNIGLNKYEKCPPLYLLYNNPSSHASEITLADSQIFAPLTKEKNYQMHFCQRQRHRFAVTNRPILADGINTKSRRCDALELFPFFSCNRDKEVDTGGFLPGDVLLLFLMRSLRQALCQLIEELKSLQCGH